MIDMEKQDFTVALASDHAGVDLKRFLGQKLQERGVKIVDLGTDDKNISVDYPDYGYELSKLLALGTAQYGVIICGTGIGISIAANRNPKIRAALCTTPEMAMLARQHNDANVLALGARIIDQATALECLNIFLTTEFSDGRHKIRVNKLSHPEC